MAIETLFSIAIWDFVGFTPEEDIIIVALEQHILVLCGNHTRASHNIVTSKIRAYKFSHRFALGAALVLTDSFLGWFCSTSTIPRFWNLFHFQAVLNPLLSASDLVYLYLCDTPSVYISSEVLTPSLS